MYFYSYYLRYINILYTKCPIFFHTESSLLVLQYILVLIFETHYECSTLLLILLQ